MSEMPELGKTDSQKDEAQQQPEQKEQEQDEQYDDVDYQPEFIKEFLDNPPILASECPDVFRQVFESFEFDYGRKSGDGHRPKSDLEYTLVMRATVATWELLRYDKMKVAIIGNHRRSAAESLHRRISSQEVLPTNEDNTRKFAGRYFSDPAYRAEFSAKLERAGYVANGVEGEAFLRALPSLATIDRMITSTEKRLERVLQKLDDAYATRDAEHPMPLSSAAQAMAERQEQEVALIRAKRKADSGQ